MTWAPARRGNPKGKLRSFPKRQVAGCSSMVASLMPTGAAHPCRSSRHTIRWALTSLAFRFVGGRTLGGRLFRLLGFVLRRVGRRPNYCVARLVWLVIHYKASTARLDLDHVIFGRMRWTNEERQKACKNRIFHRILSIHSVEARSQQSKSVLSCGPRLCNTKNLGKAS